MCGESGGVVFEKTAVKKERENTADVSENDILV